MRRLVRTFVVGLVVVAVGLVAPGVANATLVEGQIMTWHRRRGSTNELKRYSKRYHLNCL